MTDDQRKMIEEGCAQFESCAGLVWGPEFIEEFLAAIRAALAEIDALKADLAARTVERDDARRELCLVLGGFDTTRALRIAEHRGHRGWNCFDAKEAKP
jgi:hypothetical protein